MSSPLKVMLVDDHALCRSGLTELLQHRLQIIVGRIAAIEADIPRAQAKQGKAFLWWQARLKNLPPLPHGWMELLLLSLYYPVHTEMHSCIKIR